MIGETQMIGDKQTSIINKFPHLRSSFSILENYKDEMNIEILKTKDDQVATLSVTIDKRPYYLHSKYDPIKEAEILIDRYKDELDKYDHVLFYGVGLGYHVEELLNRYPKLNYSMFEPIPYVFKRFLELNRLEKLDLNRLKNLYIDTVEDGSEKFLLNLTLNIQERILLIVLPSYERVFNQKSQEFAEHFREAITRKYESYYIDNKYSSRWTLNSLINLPVTLSSPNILNGYEEVFKDKPLIIVSAGPSLEEEYEKLRKIKAQKTAFIFAVGSANKALIVNGIIPDAVCTYDPQEINYSVFTKMLENDVIDVPMIYGTSVGFETLKHYPGPKLHMITSQDTVTPYYIGDSAQYVKRINDAPTIAAVTLQLACELKSNPIILVGQNLALKGEQRYSSEIENEKEKIEEDKENIVMVEDVHGNLIKSTKGFINMKTYLEHYVSSYKNIEVINTTNGGAAIIGTKYQPLSLLMEERLKIEVVSKDWHKKQSSYIENTLSNKIGLVEQSIEQYLKLHKRVLKYFIEIEELAEKKQARKLDKAINQLNNEMQKLTNNEFYKVYILPINRTQYQALIIRATEIRKTEDIYQKAKLVLNAFLPYVNRCKQTMDQVIGSVYNVHLLLETNAKKQHYKFYASDCGAFDFQGEWKKENYAPSKMINYPVKQMVSSGDSKLEFKFTGTSFKIFGSTSKLGSKNMEIRIDGNVKRFTTHINKNEELFAKRINQMLFQESNLENKEHHVVIKGEGNFYFTGVEIERTGRLFHVNEVTDINTIKIGERIRCHYAAKYNKVGQFYGLGEETGSFLPPEASAYPDGDFYFIMVDKEDGKSKLIADRNVQHSISWDVLNRCCMVHGINQTVDNSSGIIRILSGGIGYSNEFGKLVYPDNLRFGGYPRENEWTRYIESCEESNSDHKWNWSSLCSWCMETPIVASKFRYGDGSFKIESANENSRIRVGHWSQGFRNVSEKTEIQPSIGFRPLFIIDSFK